MPRPLALHPVAPGGVSQGPEPPTKPLRRVVCEPAGLAGKPQKNLLREIPRVGFLQPLGTAPGQNQRLICFHETGPTAAVVTLFDQSAQQRGAGNRLVGALHHGLRSLVSGLRPKRMGAGGCIFYCVDGPVGQ